mmetsp:Transcript_108383/g.162156  ORF Transcript_108383/g.162156 Transcript_108383/m.162156 type:complete len:110 (-) Transcript_108383:414-743(-)
MFATCGCRTTKSRIIAKIVDFVALVELKTSSTAMTVACVSTRAYIQTITARVENTNPIALYVKSFSSVREARLMKCLVVTQYTGSVFGSLRRTILDAQCAKRRRRRKRG